VVSPPSDVMKKSHSLTGPASDPPEDDHEEGTLSRSKSDSTLCSRSSEFDDPPETGENAPDVKSAASCESPNTRQKEKVVRTKSGDLAAKPVLQLPPRPPRVKLSDAKSAKSPPKSAGRAGTLPNRAGSERTGNDSPRITLAGSRGNVESALQGSVGSDDGKSPKETRSPKASSGRKFSSRPSGPGKRVGFTNSNDSLRNFDGETNVPLVDAGPTLYDLLQQSNAVGLFDMMPSSPLSPSQLEKGTLNVSKTSDTASLFNSTPDSSVACTNLSESGGVGAPGSASCSASLASLGAQNSGAMQTPSNSQPWRRAKISSASLSNPNMRKPPQHLVLSLELDPPRNAGDKCGDGFLITRHGPDGLSDPKERLLNHARGLFDLSDSTDKDTEMPVDMLSTCEMPGASTKFQRLASLPSKRKKFQRPPLPSLLSFTESLVTTNSPEYSIIFILGLVYMWVWLNRFRVNEHRNLLVRRLLSFPTLSTSIRQAVANVMTSISGAEHEYTTWETDIALTQAKRVDLSDPLDPKMGISTKTLALAMSHVASRYLRAIPYTELLKKNWTKKERSPNYHRLIEHTNFVYGWLSAQIVISPRPSVVICRVISLLKNLQKLNNFLHMFCVTGALTRWEVVRMKKCWKDVPSRKTLLLNSAVEITSVGHNYAQYRNAVEQIFPCSMIPFTGTWGKDLSLLEEHVTFSDRTKTVQLVALPKLEVVAKLLLFVCQVQHLAEYSVHASSSAESLVVALRHSEASMSLMPDQQLFAHASQHFEDKAAG